MSRRAHISPILHDPIVNDDDTDQYNRYNYLANAQHVPKLPPDIRHALATVASYVEEQRQGGIYFASNGDEETEVEGMLILHPTGKLSKPMRHRSSRKRQRSLDESEPEAVPEPEWAQERKKLKKKEKETTSRLSEGSFIEDDEEMNSLDEYMATGSELAVPQTPMPKLRSSARKKTPARQNVVSIKQIQITKGNLVCTIKQQDSVYVVPHGSLKNVDLTKDFRMAYVKELKGAKAPFYLYVQYYRSVLKEDEAMILAPTELLFDDKVEWISSDKIIDNMRWYFRVFNDSSPTPPRMNSQIWFLRQERTKCTICQGDYNPAIDQQRYCYECQLWFHDGCLGDVVVGLDWATDQDYLVIDQEEELDKEMLGDDGLPAIFDQVLQGPTVRGQAGEYDFDNNWLNTGSGVQKGLIEDWQKQEQCPEDWLEQLGENFLEDFLGGKTWKFYACPICSSHV
ncbi:hypothetical protein BYT27DRAFT_7202127 [Phlegmacium glaucopus]|nr:hypothetical protein BYT27DRAFT_7202127 [Phlegmacium glaucopus]